MLTWFNRTFRKSKAIRIYLVTLEGRLLEYWRVPKGGEVDLGEYGIFILEDRDSMYLSSKNVPTFICTENNAEPQNVLLDMNKRTYYSPKRYKVAINENVSEALINATLNEPIKKDTIVLAGVMLMGFLGLGYYLSGNQQAIIEALNSLGIGVG